MSTKAKRKSRGDIALEKEQRKKDRTELGLEFKGTKIDHEGPPHLWPNEYIPLVRSLKRRRRR